MGLSCGDQSGRINSSHSIIQEFARSDWMGLSGGDQTCQNNFPTCQNNFPTCQNNFPTCPAKIIFPPAKIIFPPAKIWLLFCDRRTLHHYIAQSEGCISQRTLHYVVYTCSLYHKSRLVLTDQFTRWSWGRIDILGFQPHF